MKQKTGLQKKQIKTVWILILVCVLAVLLSIFAWKPLLRFISDPERVRTWIDENSVMGRIGYMLMVIFQIIIAVIPGEPLEIAAGYAFGAVEGTALCMLSAFLGSILVFALVRRYGIRLVEAFFDREKIESVRFLKTSNKRDFLLLVVFTIPGTPKDLLCYFAGLTDIPFAKWMLICSLGRIPSIITSTLGGSALGTSNYTYAVLVFAITIGVSALGLYAYNKIKQQQGKKEER